MTVRGYHPAGLVVGGLPYIVSSTWFLDPVNGSDSNSGVAVSAPLKTPAELQRRWSGRVFDPSFTAITLSIASGVLSQPLILDGFTLPNPASTLTISGTMALHYSGALTGFTAFNPAGGIRSVFSDAGADFSTLRRRIRMTSGPASEGLSWYNSIAAATDAQPGAFALLTGATSGIVPAVGNTFALESPLTITPGYSIRSAGMGTVVIRDLKVAGAGVKNCYLWCNPGGRVFGCHFDATGGTVAVAGRMSLVSCMSDNGFLSVTASESVGMTTHHFFGQCQIVGGGYVTANNAIHDGNGTSNVQLFVSNGARLEDGGTVCARCFFGCLGGSELVELSDGGGWTLGSTNARFWGAAGNTATNALQVFNGSGIEFVTLPTATGAVPGQDVVLAGGVALAWAAIPAVAAAPNNAYALLRV